MPMGNADTRARYRICLTMPITPIKIIQIKILVVAQFVQWFPMIKMMFNVRSVECGYYITLLIRNEN